MTMNVQAIVLSREDWREHDCLLTLYTRERGKVEAVAKGLRRAESKLAGHLEPLMQVEVFLVQGRRWLIVAGSVIQDARHHLRSDLDRVVLAGSIARLVNIMTPLESREERVLSLLEDTLAVIDGGVFDKQQGQLLVHLVAWKLLVLSGYQPELKRCAVCRHDVEDPIVLLNSRRGGVAHRVCLDPEKTACVVVSRTAVKGLAYMVDAPIEHVTRLRGSEAAFSEMSAVISSLIEERFEVSAGGWLQELN